MGMSVTNRMYVGMSVTNRMSVTSYVTDANVVYSSLRYYTRQTKRVVKELFPHLDSMTTEANNIRF